MTSDNPLVEMLIRHEGVVKLNGRHVPYDDASGARLDSGDTVVGKITLGIGRNIQEVGITDDEAMLLLTNDLERVRCELNQALPWWITLSEARRAVLVSMVFNMGLAGFLKFKTTIGHIEHGEYVQAADAMLDSKWAKQVGPRATELAEMMRSGKWKMDA